MTNFFTYFIFFLGTVASVSLHAQTIDAEPCNLNHWEWATAISTSDYYESTSDIKVNQSGHVYITGHFQTQVIFGDSTYTNLKGNDAYLARFDNAGNLLWSTHIISSGFSRSLNIITDVYDNVYVLGSFSDSLVLEGNVLVSSSQSEDIYIAKYSSENELQWIKSYGGDDRDNPGDIIADNVGNTFVTGTFENATEIGGVSLKSNAGMDFIYKIDSEGKVDWLQQFGNSYFTGTKLAVKSNNHIVISGLFSRSISIQEIVLEAPQSAMPPYTNATFLAEFSTEGDLQWLKTATSGENSDIVLAVDRSDAIYLGGHFSDEYQGGFIVGDSTYSGRAGYVAKFDAEGGAVWSRKIGDGYFNHVSGIAIDAGNNVFVSGLLTTTTQFAGQPVAGFGGFLAKYHSSSEELKFWETGGFSYDKADFICSDPAGKIYSTGLFSGTISFGDHTVSSPDFSGGFFIAGLGPESSLLAPEPDMATSAISFSNITPGSVDISWENGDGSGRIVIAKKLGKVKTTGIADGENYDDGEGIFGNGTQTGQRQFVVYRGSGNHATVTGLEQNRLYSFTALEYNEEEVCPSATNYKTSQNRTSFLVKTKTNLLAEGLMVAPNPIEEDINLTLTTSLRGNRNLILMNQFGVPVQTYKLKITEDVTKESIDISSLNLVPGIYFLKLNAKDGHVFRLVKK